MEELAPGFESKIAANSVPVQCTASDNCCEIGITCPSCAAPTIKIKKKRVRREIRTLSTNAYARVTAAMRTLKNRKSGKNYDYFVAKQIASNYDSRGSQSNYGPHYSTWHSLFLLEFEEELLKIDRKIGALPYWDWEITTPSVLTTEYVGTQYGTGSGYQIILGPFSAYTVAISSTQWWNENIVSNFTTADATLDSAAPNSTIDFTGATFSGRLRNADSLNTNQYVTRHAPYSISPGNRCFRMNTTDPIQLGPSSDCSSSLDFPFMAWYACIDANVTFARPPWDSESYLRTPLNYIGGTLNCTNFKSATTTEQFNLMKRQYDGDLKDPYSSSNDPLFWFHHANVDRRRMIWMSNHSADGSAAYYYGYPLYGARKSGPGKYTLLKNNSFGGVGLNEDISHHFGFRDADVGISAHGNKSSLLWTHADAICWLSPKTSIYTYDTLLPPPTPLDPGVPIINPAMAKVIMTVSVVLMITLLSSLELYRWQYIWADKAKQEEKRRQALDALDNEDDDEDDD